MFKIIWNYTLTIVILIILYVLSAGVINERIQGFDYLCAMIILASVFVILYKYPVVFIIGVIFYIGIII